MDLLTISAARRHARLMALAIFAGILIGCGGSDVDRSAEFEELLSAENYTEILSRAEVYEAAGEVSPVLDYARGVALLLGQDADLPARRSFNFAVEQDSSLAPRVARLWQAAAIADHSAGWYERAKSRMHEGFLNDHDIQLEPVADGVADILFRTDKNWQSALEVYSHLKQKKGVNQSMFRRWHFRYGYCLERLGDIDGAIAAYQDFRERWPADRNDLKSVTWRLEWVLMERADAAIAAGDSDEAMKNIEEVLSIGWHLDMQQRARLAAGAALELRDDLEGALEYYEMIVADGDESGGEVLKDAKNHLDRIHNLGIH